MSNAVFNSYDFALNGLSIHILDMYSRSPRTLQLESIAVGDGSTLVSHRYGPKPVTIEGLLKAATSTALEAKIDEVIAALSVVGGTLDIDHAGGTRRFICSSANIAIDRENYGATVVGYSVEFMVPSGYGSDTASSSFGSGQVTTATGSIAVTVGGSYKAAPDIDITLTAVNAGGPAKAIRIGNPANGTGLSITADFITGDVISLRGEDRLVYRNGQTLYGTGIFPTWEPGVGSIEYADDFTTRTADITGTYTKRWL